MHWILLDNFLKPLIGGGGWCERLLSARGPGRRDEFVAAGLSSGPALRVRLQLARAAFCGRGAQPHPAARFAALLAVPSVHTRSCFCRSPGRGASRGTPRSSRPPGGAVGGGRSAAGGAGRSALSAARPGRGLRPPPVLFGSRVPSAAEPAAPRSASLGPRGRHAAEVTGGGRTEERAVPGGRPGAAGRPVRPRPRRSPSPRPPNSVPPMRERGGRLSVPGSLRLRFCPAGAVPGRSGSGLRGGR